MSPDVPPAPNTSQQIQNPQSQSQRVIKDSLRDNINARLAEKNGAHEERPK